MSTFGDRLDRVELIFMPIDCDHCRSWARTVLVAIDPVTGVEIGSRPRQCPRCGRVLPITREIVIEQDDDPPLSLVRIDSEWLLHA